MTPSQIKEATASTAAQDDGSKSTVKSQSAEVAPQVEENKDEDNKFSISKVQAKPMFERMIETQKQAFLSMDTT